MVENDLPDRERELAERLRREASAARPEFSEALHAKLCSAIRPPQARPARRVTTPWPVARWLPLAAAMALLVGVYFASRPPAESPSSPNGPTGPEVVTVGAPDPAAEFDQIADSASRTVRDVGKTVDSEVSAGQWGYLDHDARLAIKLLKDQLPLSVASND